VKVILSKNTKAGGITHYLTSNYTTETGKQKQHSVGTKTDMITSGTE
jgi:hypothetical protein